MEDGIGIELPEVGPGGRRRFTLEQKRALLKQATQPGQSISSVARQYGVAPSMLFTWRKAFRESDFSLFPPAQTIPARRKNMPSGRFVAKSEIEKRDTRIAELERALGRKTMEVEILQEALRGTRENSFAAPLADEEPDEKLSTG